MFDDIDKSLDKIKKTDVKLKKLLIDDDINDKEAITLLLDNLLFAYTCVFDMKNTDACELISEHFLGICKILDDDD